ncbi:unnamed protein product, partial [Iphiclides podalirius]
MRTAAPSLFTSSPLALSAARISDWEKSAPQLSPTTVNTTAKPRYQAPGSQNFDVRCMRPRGLPGRSPGPLSLQELHALQRIHLDWAHVGRPDIIFYSPKQIQHLIRLDTALGRAAAMATLPPMWHDRRAPQASTHSPYESTGNQTPSGRPWTEWSNLASGWAAGAVLLMAALLLVRYIDRCLARKLLNYRYPNGDSDAPGLSESEPPSESRDPPPPYSECAQPQARRPSKRRAREEPPPPYSACYFANPKDGAPSVHLYTGHGLNTRTADGDKPDRSAARDGATISGGSNALGAASSSCDGLADSHVVDIDRERVFSEEVC